MKNVIVVMSGKGGVGKTTVATDLARYLKAGILDVDVMAPNAPTLVGGELEREMSATDQGIHPAIQDGLEIVSLKYDLPEDTVYAKTGEFKYNQIRQFIALTKWKSDTIVIDHPPGTGTESRTVLSMLPDAKAIVVTTGRDVSIEDCRRSIKMLLNAKVNLLGVVENMTYYQPPQWMQELIDKADPKDLPDDTGLPLFGDDDLEEKFIFEKPVKYKAPVIGKIPYIPSSYKRVKVVGEIYENAIKGAGQRD